MFISHVESIKPFKSSVYSATAVGISWVSSAGHIWSAPSGLWMENHASLKDTHDNRSFCPITILIYCAALIGSIRALNFADKKFHRSLSIVKPRLKNSLHRSHFQTKQLSFGWRNEFAWSTQTWVISTWGNLLSSCKIPGFQNSWIPIEMTGFCRWHFIEQCDVL